MVVVVVVVVVVVMVVVVKSGLLLQNMARVLRCHARGDPPSVCGDGWFEDPISCFFKV